MSSSSNYDYSHPTGFPPPPSPHGDRKHHSTTPAQVASTSYLSPPANSRSNSATNSPNQVRRSPGDQPSRPGGNGDSKSPRKSTQSISQPGDWSPGGTHLVLGAPMGAHQQAHSKRPREEQKEATREASMEDENAEYDQALFDEARVKHRRRTSPPQLKILEHYFGINPKPDVELRRSLSTRLNMSPREVQVWFQNRRAKIKKAREKEEQFREMDQGQRDCHSPDSGFAENRLHQQAHDRAGLQLHGIDPMDRRRSNERSSGSNQGYWDASNNPGFAWEAPRQYYAPPPSLRYPDSYYHPNPSAVYPSPLSGASGSALPSPVQSPDSYLPLRDHAASAEQAAYYNRRLSLPNSATGRFNAAQWNPNEYGGRNEPRSFGSVGSALGPPPRVYSASPGHVNALLAGMELESNPDNFKSPEFVHRPAPLVFRHSDPTRGSLHDPQSPGSASSVGDEPSTEYQNHRRFYQPPRQQSPAYLYHPVSTQPSLERLPPTFDNYTFGVVSPSIEEPQSFLPSTQNIDPSYSHPGSDANGDEGLRYNSMINRRASCPPHLTQSFDDLGVGETNNGGSTIWAGDMEENGSIPRPPRISHRHSIAAVPSPSPRSLHAALSASAPASSKPPRPYPPPGTVLANFSPPPSESFSLGSLLQQHQSLVNPTSPLGQSNGNGNGNGNIYERRSSALDTISESSHYSHTSPSGHRYEMDQSISMSDRRGSGWRGSEVLFQNRRSSTSSESQLLGGNQHQTVQESLEGGEVSGGFELVGGEQGEY